MPELNPALFDPLTRIENACRRASNIMLIAVDPPRDNEMVLREIQEIREALEALKAAVEAGEMTGLKHTTCPHLTCSAFPRAHPSKSLSLTQNRLRRPLGLSHNDLFDKRR